MPPLPNDNSYVIKLILAGDVMVGKTSLRLRYMGKGFAKNYLPTIGADFSHKTIELGEYNISFSIWDLAGQQQFQRIHPQYFRASLGAMVMWDVTNMETFENLEYWVGRVIEFNENNGTTIVVIGNKLDLISHKEREGMEKKQAEYVEKLREKHPDFAFYGMFTSALTGENVDASFTSVAENVIKRINVASTKSKKNDKFSKVIPAIYTVSNNPNLGPLITSSLPFDKRGSYNQETHDSIDSIINLFDFNSQLNINNFISKVPWKDPKGMAFYSIAVDDSHTARKFNIFHLVIIVVADRYTEKFQDGTQSGMLRDTLNELRTFYLTLIKSEKLNFTTITANPLLAYSKSRKQISDHMEKLRRQLYEIIINMDK